ncbi:MAG TPA: FAD-dependent oxidoreductase [Acidimicrobiia bacterium]|nr:FAD-dependent oxidoreductase [Acidimicrobiia bacterium]
MVERFSDVVVCGAGIVGVATAYSLAVRAGLTSVTLCDPLPPLTLTSDKSTECYRNLWPNRPMVTLMNRSIDIIEELARESGNAFNLNRRGYVYASADPDRLAAMHRSAEAAAQFGSGPVRVHRGSPGDPPYQPAAADGWEDAPTGTDLVTDTDMLHHLWPGMSERTVGALHVRRAGWLSAQQLGAYLLDRARATGVTVLRRRVTSVELTDGRVTGVGLDDGTRIACGAFVNAAGPMLDKVAGLLGESLPVLSEVHLKVAFKDHLGVMPRNAGLMIWNDPQHVGWSGEERDRLAAEGRRDLIDEMPISCHGRPEGGGGSSWVLALWEYRRLIQEPVWPLPADPLYGEVVIRGLATMFPGMAAYADAMPRRIVDGGYYTKTVENRPLAGPMRTSGAFVAGAVSGFGIMAACGVADLVTAHVTEASLPDHAGAFMLDRYDDPAYQRELEALTETGQI